MPTTDAIESLRRRAHVYDVYEAIGERLAAVRSTQTVLNGLVASGRVDVAHTNPCWAALEDELRWLGSSHTEIGELATSAAYDLVAFWSPEMIRGGVGPAPAPSPVVPL